MLYGLDVHKDFFQVCALAEDGQTRRDFRVGGHAEAIEAFGQRLARTDQVVLEATFHSWAIAQILRRYVDRVVVADPAQLKAIANARIKTDKVDAHILAQLLRMDFLPEVELPAAATWAVRQLMAHRNQLRRQSVATKNTIHAVLNRSLLRYPGSFLFTEKGYRWLAELALPPVERMVLDHLTALLREVQARLAGGGQALVEQARLLADAKLLVTIPGVDVVVAMGFLAAIGSVDRFPTPQRLVRIRRARVHGHEVTPKSGRSREVPIGAAGPELRRVLTELAKTRLRREGVRDPWLVFLSPTGQPIEERNLSRAWAALRREFGRLGVRPLRLHDARHTFASHALEARVSVRRLASWLGHASPETTLRIYAHVVPEGADGWLPRDLPSSSPNLPEARASVERETGFEPATLSLGS